MIAGLACLLDWYTQGGPAEAAGYSPSEETLQRFWEHCEDILGRAAVEVPEPSLDADSQAQRLQHAKLEQVSLTARSAEDGGVCVCVACGGRRHPSQLLQPSQLSV